RAAKAGSVVTSSTVTLTVVDDTTPPKALEVLSSPGNLNEIAVRFDEAMVDTDLQEEFNFILQETGLPAQVATNSADNLSAILTFDTPLVLNQTYNLEVRDVRDLATLQISPNPTVLTFVAGSNVPRLSISRSGNNLVITWPAPSTGYILEQTDSLSPPAWTAVAGTPAVINGRNTLNVTASVPLRIYRLVQLAPGG
ncbi:MAG: Ig-like domain-containing protein, partial [Verrucomicrobia subdivision 3 bacterium]|nr:Ig-like domain-containing protein [Limisphaerales bacterium]